MFISFLKKYCSKIKKVLSVLSLSFIFLFFPLSTLAFWQQLTNAILGLPRDAVKYIMGALVYLAGLFAQVTGAFLDLVTSPNFISLPYTKPGSFPEGNPIIDSGLSITQSLVNLALVVILVFIALSIALRLKEYASQKTLVRLIAIALLVNFAPVFCGVIVDASNIAMNYFLVGIKEGVSGILTDISTEGLTGALTRPGTVTIFSLVARGAILIILNLSIGLAFLLLVFIFLFRYVAIWLLVILSPLAFVAWILPKTKKFWDIWWKQFLQWSFIGIPMAFFLYLAMGSMAGIRIYFQTGVAAPGLESSVTGLLDRTFPYFVITAMIYLGFFIGLSTSAMGATSAISFAKWSGRRAKGAAKWGTRQTAGRFLASERGKKTMKYIKKLRLRIPKMREAKSVTGVIGGALATVTGARWALRGVTKVGAVYGAAQEKRIEEEKKKIAQQFGKDYARAAMTYDSILPHNYHKKIAMARYLAETKGDKALGELSEKEAAEAIRLNATYSPGTVEDVVKYKLGLIKKDTKLRNIVKKAMVGRTLEAQFEDKDVKALRRLGIGITEAIEGAVFKKAVDALKEKDVENLSEEVRDIPEFQQMTARFKGWGFIRKIGEEKGLDWLEKIQKTAQEEIGVSEIARSNPSFLRAANTPAGRMFLSPWKRAKGKGAEIEGPGELNRIVQQAPPLVSDAELKRQGEEYIEAQKKIKAERKALERIGIKARGRRPGGMMPRRRRPGGGVAPKGRRF